ncbi:MAG: Ig-like domain-containing protein [Nannocystales bacterium]
MLGDPKRLKTRNGYGYLISWKHKLRVASQGQAESLARRILEDAANVEQIRAALGRPEASVEELESWLATGLASEHVVALKTKPQVPVFDEPPIQDLKDLLPPHQPSAQPRTGFVDIALFEQDGASVANEPYRIISPDFEEFRGTLDDDGRAHHDPVAYGVCRVSFPHIDKGDWVARPGPPAPELPFVDVVVTDEEGQPVAGAQWEFELPGGAAESGTTDASGRIFIPDLEFASIGRLVVTQPPSVV